MIVVVVGCVVTFFFSFFHFSCVLSKIWINNHHRVKLIIILYFFRSRHSMQRWLKLKIVIHYCVLDVEKTENSTQFSHELFVELNSLWFIHDEHWGECDVRKLTHKSLLLKQKKWNFTCFSLLILPCLMYLQTSQKYIKKNLELSSLIQVVRWRHNNIFYIAMKIILNSIDDFNCVQQRKKNREFTNNYLIFIIVSFRADQNNLINSIYLSRLTVECFNTSLLSSNRLRDVKKSLASFCLTSNQVFFSSVLFFRRELGWLEKNMNRHIPSGRKFNNSIRFCLHNSSQGQSVTVKKERCCVVKQLNHFWVYFLVVKKTSHRAIANSL